MFSSSGTKVVIKIDNNKKLSTKMNLIVKFKDQKLYYPETEPQVNYGCCPVIGHHSHQNILVFYTAPVSCTCHIIVGF